VGVGEAPPDRYHGFAWRHVVDHRRDLARKFLRRRAAVCFAASVPVFMAPATILEPVHQFTACAR
jgi:hypothetical protein